LVGFAATGVVGTGAAALRWPSNHCRSVATKSSKPRFANTGCFFFFFFAFGPKSAEAGSVAVVLADGVRRVVDADADTSIDWLGPAAGRDGVSLVDGSDTLAGTTTTRPEGVV
jgi:hypothetical protein